MRRLARHDAGRSTRERLDDAGRAAPSALAKTTRSPIFATTPQMFRDKDDSDTQPSTHIDNRQDGKHFPAHYAIIHTESHEFRCARHRRMSPRAGRRDDTSMCDTPRALAGHGEVHSGGRDGCSCRRAVENFVGRAWLRRDELFDMSAHRKSGHIRHHRIGRHKLSPRHN